MPQTITTGYKALVEAAEKEIETLPVEQAVKLAGRDDTVLVDIRDIRELSATARCRAPSIARAACWNSGSIRTAHISSRCSAQDKKFVFFCAGGLRSALAAQIAQRMGLKPVAHIHGGFGAWKKAGGPVEPPAEESRRRVGPRFAEDLIHSPVRFGSSAKFACRPAPAPDADGASETLAVALKLIIGNKNYSSWSFRPWIAMKVAGIPFEEEVIPLGDAGIQKAARGRIRAPARCRP